MEEQVNRKSDIMVLRMDPRLKMDIKEQAKKLDVSMSKYIVLALQHFKKAQPAYRPQRYNQ